MAPQDLTPEQWLELMPLPALRAKVDALEAETKVWRELLALRSQGPEKTRQPLPESNGTTPTVRQAITAVLKEEGHAMAPATIRKKLIGRGWVRPDRSGASQVYAMLSRMAKAGQAVRRANGTYAISGR